MHEFCKRDKNGVWKMNPETPIYPMSTPPVNEGVYKVYYLRTKGYFGFSNFSYGIWNLVCDNAHCASDFAAIKSRDCYNGDAIGWSGLTKKGHDAAAKALKK